MKVNLFGWGKSSEKRTAKVLPEHLASLFGAEEGQEVIVDATESGLAAIEAAESRLVAFNEAMGQYEKDNNQLKADLNTAETQKESAETLLEAEQNAHKATEKAFNDFKAGTDESHSFVDKEGDDFNPSTEPANAIRKGEAEARKQGEKIKNANQNK